jgi:anti-sigma B factor antagonist
VADYRGAAVVGLHGELDLLTAPCLRAELAALIAAGHRDVIVDLEGVTFIDSSGLHVLIEASAAAAQRHGHLSVVCTNPSHLRVFDVAGVSALLKIRPSLTAAITSMVEGVTGA